MQTERGFRKISQIKRWGKPPAYQWQDLALRIIEELSIPKFKKNAVFKVCKEYPKNFIERCLVDTQELATTDEKWKYFFKIVNQGEKKKN